jgi:excisionase family DNA binding protein
MSMITIVVNPLFGRFITMGPILMTKQVAAEILGVSTVTLDRFRMAGKIRYRKFGHLVRFTEEDIQDFIETSATTEWTPNTRGQA